MVLTDAFDWSNYIAVAYSSQVLLYFRFKLEDEFDAAIAASVTTLLILARFFRQVEEAVVCLKAVAKVGTNAAICVRS